MSKFNFSQRERIIFVVLNVILVVFILYKGVFLPLSQKTSMLESRINSEEKKLYKALKTIRKSQAVEKKYKTTLSHLQQNSSDEQVMTSIFSEIEAIAKNLNLRIDDMKSNKVKKLDAYNSFSVGLTIKGTFEEMMHFIYDLQSYPHLFYVDEARLARQARIPDQIECRLQLSRILIPQ